MKLTKIRTISEFQQTPPPPLYRCAICNESFESQEQAISHLDTAHKPPAKPENETRNEPAKASSEDDSDSDGDSDGEESDDDDSDGDESRDGDVSVSGDSEWAGESESTSSDGESDDLFKRRPKAKKQINMENQVNNQASHKSNKSNQVSASPVQAPALPQASDYIDYDDDIDFGTIDLNNGLSNNVSDFATSVDEGK